MGGRNCSGLEATAKREVAVRFHIGPEVYTVRIAEDRIYQDGDELLGLCVYASREIQLSPTLKPEHRLTTLLHELRHAWQFHVPKPRTDEEEADLSAMVMKAFWRDYREQNGDATLKKLGFIAEVLESADSGEASAEDIWPDGPRITPLEQIEPAEAPVQSAAGGASCGRCDTKINDRAIVTSKPRFHIYAKGWVVDRALFCPHCGHVQRWIEGANLDGVPNGAPLDEEPEYVRGPQAEEFLRQHPEAVGLIPV